MAKKNEQTIIITPMAVKQATIYVQGDGDLVLNKMNASAVRALMADDRKTQAIWEKQHENRWEQIITAIHWRDGIPCEDTNAD